VIKRRRYVLVLVWWKNHKLTGKPERKGRTKSVGRVGQLVQFFWRSNSPQSRPDLIRKVVKGIQGSVADEVVGVLLLGGSFWFGSGRCGGGWRGRCLTLVGGRGGISSLLVTEDEEKMKGREGEDRFVRW